MAHFDTEYQRLEASYSDSPPGEENLLMHVTEGTKSHWHHIENLDLFFQRVYNLHQKNGFTCMLLGEIFELVQLLFVVGFTVFLANCVDYDILFANKFVNHTDSSKVTLPDAFVPLDVCSARIGDNAFVMFVLIISGVFWLHRLVKFIYNVCCYWEIRSFYINALKMTMSELPYATWQEVQARIVEIQKEHQICIHKKELTELDIYHRILRFKNYMVAMVNKSLLPVRFQLPLLGDVVFFTRGLKYNFELIFFWGPGSLFENEWSLKSEYKRGGNRLELADRLASRILWIGVANLLLCPVILVWQILYAFFSYTEVIKREPGSLGARCWSLYGRCYLRHFNELDHELMSRLSKGYKVFILEELLSPVVTPIILIFCLRRKSLEIIDFFRNFTVEVVGVGDTCSFAQMDIRQHGHPAWMSEGKTEASIYQQAEDGKTELSLMHFAITNPQWQPPRETTHFISQLKERVQREATGASSDTHPLSESEPRSLIANLLVAPSTVASVHFARDGSLSGNALAASDAVAALRSLSPISSSLHLRGSFSAAYRTAGPTSALSRTMTGSGLDARTVSSGSSAWEAQLTSLVLSEYASTEMSIHALYIHELHKQQSRGDALSRHTWHRQESDESSDSVLDEVKSVSGSRYKNFPRSHTFPTSVPSPIAIPSSASEGAAASLEGASTQQSGDRCPHSDALGAGGKVTRSARVPMGGWAEEPYQSAPRRHESLPEESSEDELPPHIHKVC
ncbi:autophagy-related protein 9A isoform X2 [Corythoichthys intestinalis]|uniref:autophagy-related protein 9A isoform X2 n=1 Tax=Corythoichthys intestinalis TaxID=161448 RepID=UPI0025A64C48|nr:autophagy-related protein 9A isoform X2 [Corythoichthys intestinalis]